MIQDRGDDRIVEDELHSFKVEVQERCILPKSRAYILRQRYTEKGSFSIKEAYDIRTRNQEGEDEIWKKVWETNPWPKISTFCQIVVK